MRNYNLDQEVNWRQITETMDNLLQRRSYQVTGAADETARLLACDLLRQDLAVTKELRKFLRLSQLTKAQKEAETLLDSISAQK